MKSVVVIAPHPDDETLGCGGTLLRHKAEGDNIYWLIVSGISEDSGYSHEQVRERTEEIRTVADAYSFDSVHALNLPAAKLDQVGLSNIIAGISSVFQKVQPNWVYLPFRGDVHTDHRWVFDAVSACTKWFRYGHVKRVMAYETLSETGFGIEPVISEFQPNLFVDITPYLDRKIEIAHLYGRELGEFPFPRSMEAIQAQATLRGSLAGCRAAEAFMLLREIS